MTTRVKRHALHRFKTFLASDRGNDRHVTQSPHSPVVGLVRGGVVKIAIALAIPAAVVAGLFAGLSRTPEILHTWLWGMVFAWAGAIVPCLGFTYLDLKRRRPKNPGNRYPTRTELVFYGGSVFTLLTVITLPDVWQLVVAGVSMSDLLAAAPARHPAVMAVELAGILVAADVLTYAEHWVMHRNRWLWRNVHVVHHRFDHAGASLFSWAGIWVHPVEALTFLLAMILVPTTLALAGVYVVHPLSLWLGLFLYVALVVEEHCGFDLPWSPHNWIPLGLGGGARPHEVHHGRARKNLGFLFKIWDRACGTYAPPVAKTPPESP